jgi:hypothetical protein
MTRPVSFERACALFVHRFTMTHVPEWAKRPMPFSGKFYAPQYRDCREWYDLTVFPGEGGISKGSQYCRSNGETWPLGKWLNCQYHVAETAP